MPRILVKSSWKKMVLVLFSILFAPPAWAKDPQVLVSIKPIHALVSGVMQGVGEPKLLLQGAASPHSYALRPSEAVLLNKADLIFWVGEDLETFLTKPLRQLAANAHIVALHTAPGIHLLPNRKTGESKEKSTQDHHEAETNDVHRHGTMDMHLWLSPTNAVAMTRAIAHALEKTDPAHASHYQDNATRLEKKIQTFALDIKRRLADIKNKPFIVFHDAYHYFEDSFGLTIAGSLSVSPDRPVSAQRLHEIRTILQSTKTLCIFSEPQFESGLVDTLTRGSTVKKGTLDPIGSDAPMGEEGWFVLMDHLVTNLVRCLGQPPA